MSGKNYVVSFL